jgi:serine/threonine-protein kinase
LQQCERLLALEVRLTAVLQGKVKPKGAAEGLDLARLCQQDYKRLYATSARLYAAAFTEQPTLADDLRGGHRYRAACAAACAGCGQGQGAAKLDDKERVRWRQQARDWLRADLALWGKHLKGKTPGAAAAMQKVLRHWQGNADLAGLRDPAALAKLPEAERQACRQLWADVAALLKQARGPDKPAGPTPSQAKEVPAKKP